MIVSMSKLYRMVHSSEQLTPVWKRRSDWLPFLMTLPTPPLFSFSSMFSIYRPLQTPSTNMRSKDIQTNSNELNQNVRSMRTEKLIVGRNISRRRGYSYGPWTLLSMLHDNRRCVILAANMAFRCEAKSIWRHTAFHLTVLSSGTAGDKQSRCCRLFIMASTHCSRGLIDGIYILSERHLVAEVVNISCHMQSAHLCIASDEGKLDDVNMEVDRLRRWDVDYERRK